MRARMPLDRTGKPRRLRRIVLIALAWFVGGVAVSMLVAWGLVIADLPLQSTATLQSIGEHDEVTTATVSGGFGSMHVELAREFGQAWSPMRAAGPPDVPAMGDNAAAWASLSQDGQKEWLELTYDRAVVPKEVRIYETLAPGAVSQVSLFGERGEWVTGWAGDDPAAPNASGIYVATIPMRPFVATDRIRIDIDSPRVSGWNEIDAVGLVGADGSLQWASSVRASSTYATAGRGGTIYPRATMRDALPGWSNPDELLPAKGFATDSRSVDARGWPMLALYGTGPSTPQMLSNVVITRPLYVTVGPPLHIWPLRPIWSGLLVDGALYGGMLALLYVSTFGLRRMARESSRLRRGCCIRCGYDLRYDFVRGCSECGWNRLTQNP